MYKLKIYVNYLKITHFRNTDDIKMLSARILSPRQTSKHCLPTRFLKTSNSRKICNKNESSKLMILNVLKNCFKYMFSKQIVRHTRD